MFSQARLDVIVAAKLTEGWDVSRIARHTGVPLERVRMTAHRLNGRDLSQADREAAHKRRHEERGLCGTTQTGRPGPRYIGPNRQRGRR